MRVSQRKVPMTNAEEAAKTKAAAAKKKKGNMYQKMLADTVKGLKESQDKDQQQQPALDSDAAAIRQTGESISKMIEHRAAMKKEDIPSGGGIGGA